MAAESYGFTAKEVLNRGKSKIAPFHDDVRASERVYNDMVSGAPQTTAIAPFLCHLPPPAANGYAIAFCVL
ncbi:hypothetical protein ETB97_010079 [Aspergillus alliaceus]|uniref:Uncharacterized protein n=1 Tax=Petromyces alliaceus TaxID=209559 RepID=A0A8H6E9D0_PETAA|nr:hypothetical protein ETB97_010079 [Aspergillus burnettii]